MRIRHLFVSSSVLALSATVAMAELTSEDVWENYQSYLSIYSENALSHSTPTRAGDALTVRDVVLKTSGEGGEMTVTLGDIVFTEEGDTVEVDMAETFPIEGQFNSEKGASRFTARATYKDLAVTASGDPDAITYDVASPDVKLELLSFESEAEDAPEDLDLQIRMRDLEGTYLLQTGDGEIEADFDLATSSFETLFYVKSDVFGEEAVSSASSAYEQVAMKGNMVMPQLDDVLSASTFLNGGFTAELEFSANSGVGLSTGNDPLAGEMSTTFSTGLAESTMRLEGGRLDVIGTAENMNYAITTDAFGPEQPFEFNIGQARGAASIPLTQTDEHVPLHVDYQFGQLALGESIWALFDPAGKLERAPFNLNLKMDMQMKWLVDLFDPALDFEDPKAQPIDVNKITVADLTIEGMGAKASMQGALDIDMAELSEFESPKVEGAMDVQAEGVNSLLTSLVAAGLIEPQQQLGFSLMLGGFTTPTGDDAFETRIELGPDQQVSINGQRVQ